MVDLLVKNYRKINGNGLEMYRKLKDRQYSKILFDWERFHMLNNIVKNSHGSRIEDFIKLLGKIKNEDGRAELLNIIAIYFPNHGTKRVLEEIRKFKKENNRYFVLSALANHLSSSEIKEVIEGIENFRSDWKRAWAYCLLTYNSPKLAKLASLAPHYISEIKNETIRGKILSSFIKLTSDIELGNFLYLIKSSDSLIWREELFYELAEELPDNCLDILVDTMWQSLEEWGRMKTLVVISKRISHYRINDMLNWIEKLYDSSSQVEVVCSMLRFLGEDAISMALNTNQKWWFSFDHTSILVEATAPLY